MARRTLCNVCGKTFTDYDEQEHIGLHTKLGYGSEYDGEVIDLDVCCECFDKMLDKLVSQCKINPIQSPKEYL